MTGRPEEEGRPWQSRPVYPNNMMPAIRMAILLVYLRRVILQDLAVFMAFEGCSGGVDWQHCLFADNPVFASRPFLDFAAEVRAAVTLAEIPTASAMARRPSSTDVPCSPTEVSPSSAVGAERSQNDPRQQQRYLPGDTALVTPLLPLPSNVSTDDEPLVRDVDAQEPLPEPSPQLLPDPLQEPLPQPLQGPLQESTLEPFQLLSQDQAHGTSCPASVAPSSLPSDFTRVEKAAARRQAVEDIKTAMVYLDYRARSQTKAVVEFSATAVLSIEALQIRMKALQDSLQRLQVKKAESKASDKLTISLLTTQALKPANHHNRRTSTAITDTMTITEQDTFAISAEWDTPQSDATDSNRRESAHTPEKSDKTSSFLRV
ncbi:hypothetical protein BGZ96_006806 [Linnemannia gamsii]|uniref:Transposase InsH N-terminal domain-containing protein n=1 Tax=Linnemannia gamsii TaxID=64522 RepID=A0ABQ7K290_9FUNG|nr:hypothetical protein BGZ96_006806 [Linnemannia gamsii]